MQIKRIAAVALILAPALAATAQEKIGLNLLKNGVYTYHSVSKLSIQQTVNGQQMNMLMNVSGTISFTVTEVRDTFYLMEARYTRLAMDMKVPNGDVSFNSDNMDENNGFSRVMSVIKDKPFPIRMTRKGRVIASSGIESLFIGIIDTLTGVSDEKKQQFKEQLTKAYGEKALKGSIEAATAIFPDIKVAKGAKWKTSTLLETGMGAGMETVYELKEITDSSYRIAASSLIKTDKEAYMETNGIPSKYDLTGTMLSEIEIDRKSGWIIASSGKQNIAGTAEIKINGLAASGMIITMIIKNELTAAR